MNFLVFAFACCWLVRWFDFLRSRIGSSDTVAFRSNPHSQIEHRKFICADGEAAFMAASLTI
jgi:hypothetical protein